MHGFHAARPGFRRPRPAPPPLAALGGGDVIWEIRHSGFDIRHLPGLPTDFASDVCSSFPFDLQPSCRQRTRPPMLEKIIRLEHTHRILFTREVFAPRNNTIRDLVTLDQPHKLPRVLVFVDEAVANANRDLLDDIVGYGEAHAETFTLTDTPIVIPGGESCKNDLRLVECCWDAINEAALDRHSYVFVIGGGAVLDLVCFAASTAHRGIRHVRFPTTTLSQGDGGVGVKNGVNYFGKKNWIGSFVVPFAVVNDFAFLESLPARERRNGIIEAIKVSLIRDGAFFEQIEAMADELAALKQEALEKIVQRSAELHVEHIATGGDPFELGSARPLDFGHWAAHKLEQISKFAVS
ncbi:MAG TPA: 3-dehydroquinate synthase, partial [Prosthecobacter sp.]|nr:3-dehydroquinate synthase [Prosthecobacter sp.]